MPFFPAPILDEMHGTVNIVESKTDGFSSCLRSLSHILISSFFAGLLVWPNFVFYDVLLVVIFSVIAYRNSTIFAIIKFQSVIQT